MKKSQNFNSNESKLATKFELYIHVTFILTKVIRTHFERVYLWVECELPMGGV